MTPVSLISQPSLGHYLCLISILLNVSPFPSRADFSVFFYAEILLSVCFLSFLLLVYWFMFLRYFNFLSFSFPYFISYCLIFRFYFAEIPFSFCVLFYWLMFIRLFWFYFIPFYLVLFHYFLPVYLPTGLFS